MDNEVQNNQPSGDQPPEAALIPPSDQPPEIAQPTRKSKLWQFTAGFLGWYLINGLVWSAYADSPSNDAFGISCLVFIVNLIILLVVILNQKIRQIGWGILTAIGSNLTVTLLLGLSNNALCFMPFFIPAE